MTDKATPGPWEYSGPYVGGGANFDDGDWGIYPPLGESGPVAIVNSEANARLIAAAFDLLAACTLAKKYLQPDLVEPGRTVFWKLVAAIKKAKGD